MNRIDVAIVRFLPFVLYILIGVCTTMIICGEDVGEFYLIHGNSAIYATALYIISLSNKRYHCKWNRAMYLFLIIVPIINYVDARWCVIPDEKTYIIMFNAMYLATAMWTAVMAIRHFRKTLKDNNNSKAYGSNNTDKSNGT